MSPPPPQSNFVPALCTAPLLGFRALAPLAMTSHRPQSAWQWPGMVRRVLYPFITLAILHPPPGDRDFHVFLVNMYCTGLYCPSALHMALHCFPITSNQSPVYSVIFSLQRRCMGVLCCYFRPKVSSPGDCVRYDSCTLGAHVLATVVGPSPNEKSL